VPDRGPVCDLCKTAQRRKHTSILCQDCADAINRVMSSDLYEANYYRNRQAQLAQARLQFRFARDSSMTSQSSKSRLPQK
jgi:hypothetical protein